MPTTHVDGQNAIRSLFFLSWRDWLTNGRPVDIRNSGGDRELPLLDYVPEIVWQNVEPENPIDYTKHWCRFVTDVVSNSQTSFRSADPALGNRKMRLTENGIIIVQMFFSKSAFERDIDRKLSAIARDIFGPRNLAGNIVWYRNPSIRYLKPEEKWFRTNVIAEYEFDEQI